MPTQKLIDGMVPWPRRLINFPIILIAIFQQFIWAYGIAHDANAMSTTAAAVPALFMPQYVFVTMLIFCTLLAIVAFHFKRKWQTVMALLPQQILLFVSAAGAIEAIRIGAFADGVVRSHDFLLVDQCLSILLAFFHMWAIFLIMRYAADD